LRELSGVTGQLDKITMVERLQKESNWLHRYTSERPSEDQEAQDSGLTGDHHRYAYSNGQNGLASYTGTETIFDFHLPAVTDQDVAALHHQAEYLLDEMEMGAADGAAFEHEAYVTGNGSQHNGAAEDSHPFPSVDVSAEDAIGLSRREGNSLPQDAAQPVKAARSQVLPESALPSIRRRPHPRRPQPALPRSLNSPATGSAGIASEASPVLSSPMRRRVAPISTKIDSSSPSISATQVQELEEEIAALHDQVKRLQKGRRDLTGHALSLLREARAILHTQPERGGRAEYNVRQVRTLLERSSESRRRSARYGVLLLLYLSLWLMLCVGGLTALFLYGAALRDILVDVSGPRSGLSIHTLPLILTLLAGGTGGVVGAIVSLVGQLRQGQEFDSQYVARYIIQPIMGVILALLIYLACLFLVNLLGLGFTDSSLIQVFPALIALPAGLWQELVYALLYRFTRFFRFGRRR
jgi:hypothetical protein